MFRAEIQWLASGPTLKLEGKLVADWAVQARRLVTKDVLPKDLIVDLTEVSYVDSVGEQLLKWLVVLAQCLSLGVSTHLPYAIDCVYRPWRGSTSDAKRLHGSSGEKSSIKYSRPVEAI
jgi:ABC-type transporter Mla MlaB component